MSHLIFDEQSIENIIIGSKVLEFGVLKESKNLKIKFQDTNGIVHLAVFGFDETGIWIEDES